MIVLEPPKYAQTILEIRQIALTAVALIIKFLFHLAA